MQCAEDIQAMYRLIRHVVVIHRPRIRQSIANKFQRRCATTLNPKLTTVASTNGTATVLEIHTRSTNRIDTRSCPCPGCTSGYKL